MVTFTLEQDTEEGAWTAVLRRGRHKLIWGQVRQQATSEARRAWQLD